MKNQPLKINEATPRPLDVIKCLSLSVVPCFRNGFLTFLARVKLGYYPTTLVLFQCWQQSGLCTTEVIQAIQVK